MNRKKSILKFIEKNQRGIEIGSRCSSLAPKAEGFNCFVLDAFDKKTLIENVSDPAIPKEKNNSH